MDEPGRVSDVDGGFDTDGDGAPDTAVVVDGIDLVVVIDMDGDGFADQVLRIGRDAGVREQSVDGWIVDPFAAEDQ